MENLFHFFYILCETILLLSEKCIFTIFGGILFFFLLYFYFYDLLQYYFYLQNDIKKYITFNIFHIVQYAQPGSALFAYSSKLYFTFVYNPLSYTLYGLLRLIFLKNIPTVLNRPFVFYPFLKKLFPFFRFFLLLWGFIPLNICN